MNSCKEPSSQVPFPKSATKAQGVCAIIVTFHPAPAHLDHLLTVRAQVSSLIVVDNASSAETIAQMRGLAELNNFEIIEHSENLGIANALNAGVRKAIADGHQWILLLDQDSRIEHGFVAQMLRDITEDIERDDSIVQIIPRYQDPITREPSYRPRYIEGPFITITSGSFFHAEAFQKCGYFADELFIYCVDDDFSIRLRRSGLRISESRTAVLLHRGGTSSRVSLFGKSYHTPNYRPAIYYYWARNRVWLLRRHGLFYPPLFVSSFRSFIGIPLKVVFGESNRAAKLWMFVRGIADGILGRTGRRIPILSDQS